MSKTQAIVQSRTLGARSLKVVKAAKRVGWALVERVPEIAPQDRHFLPLFHRYRDFMS
jgi:hypothetical protein